ncbi:MAG: DAK2 domain-containing protein [Clostridia bacterium]|nr:DAK2 domain-containing protein [Clostridia bacterium]
MQKIINGADFHKMVKIGAGLLEQNKKHIDALNVFPVPDGDTGTNMFLTLKSAVAEVNKCVDNNLVCLSEALSKGALRGARGNSGVITSQILKGFCNIVGAAKEFNTKTFAKALQEGSAVAYKAVTVPKEGTILTVIRVMAEYAVELAKKNSDFHTFLPLVLEQGAEIVKQTTDMLPVLKKAGVVDAGGKGLLIILTGFYKGLIGEELEVDFEEELAPANTMEDVLPDIHNLAEIVFGYCTEYVIIHMHKKTTEADIDKLRDKLMTLGDSVICIGDLNLVKVHVHTNNPNMALGYALELGELHGLKIENMREQNRELKALAQKTEELKPLGMVAVAPGKGIANLYKDLSVDQIIEGGQTMNPSAEDIVKAVEEVPAKNVIIFPNNKNIILAAEQARDLTTKNLVVIPTKSVPEGISCVLAFNPEGTVEDNTTAMNESFKNVKSASVTYAVRSTNLDGLELTAGDIIGLDDKSILAKGSDVSATTLELIDKMLTDDICNITLFFGEDIREADAIKLQEILSEKYPSCEVSVLDGGQPVYYYIISME